jgi:hypothetical protein
MNKHPKTKMFKTVTLFFTIVAAVSSTSRANRSFQITPEGPWLTVPSSPLEIRFSPSNRDVELVNRSSGKVIRFRLGCVIQETNKVRVVRKMPFVDANLDSGKVLLNSSTVYADDLEQCSKKKSRVSVVEVVFLDDSIWRVK